MNQILIKIFLAFIGFAVCPSFYISIAQGNRPVGTWKDHFPYEKVLEVTSGGEFVYARTDLAVFSLNPASHKVNKYSKVQGLSQSNPTAISWYNGNLENDTEGYLIIGYANGNLDLFQNGGTYNLPDIVTSNIIGDKGIRSITVEGDFAFLACGFGVVVIDLERFEVQDTWYINGQQQLLEINSVVLHDNIWVVATASGVYQAPTYHPFLSSADAWTQWEDLPESASSFVTDLIYFGNDILVHLGDESSGRLWRSLNGSPWELFPGWPAEGAELRSLATNLTSDFVPVNDVLLIGLCCSIERYDTEYNLIPETNALGGWLQVRDLEYDKNDPGVIWIATLTGGLVRFVPEPIEGETNNGVFFPSGPDNANVRRLDCWNSNLWVATGGVDETWVGLYTSVGVHGLVDGEWIDVVSLDGENDLSGIRDFLCVSIDPLNPSHVMFGSWEEGLVEVLDGEMIAIYNSSNSTIVEGDFGSSPRTGVAGVDYDKSGNLWFTNSFSTSPLQVRLADGTFIPMDLGDSFTSNDNIGGVKVTRDGYVWVILPRGGGLLVYDPAGTPGITSDDDWRFLSTSESQGALPSNYVYSVEEDLDGEIWIGTGSGPAIFYRSESLFNDDDETTASQILIQQDGNYQYLLETETVTTVVIDGGNRKWMGTSGSGVYVLSEDGMEIENHFSSENSPIPDNSILDIAINHGNGEVFVATARGIISYLGEATNWDVEMENIFVFPNPVDEFHEGPITVDGLDFESIVHITDAAGRVVGVVESMGGRAVWDGLLYDGTPAPYGVYLIFAVDRDGNTSATTKLAITR